MDSSIVKAIEYVSKKCVNNNWYRLDNEFHEFTHEDLMEINEIIDIKGVKIVQGWCFLHKARGREGLLRLIDNQGCNPKFSFRVDGKVTFGEC